MKIKILYIIVIIFTLLLVKETLGQCDDCDRVDENACIKYECVGDVCVENSITENDCIALNGQAENCYEWRCQTGYGCQQAYNCIIDTCDPKWCTPTDICEIAYCNGGSCYRNSVCHIPDPCYTYDCIAFNDTDYECIKEYICSDESLDSSDISSEITSETIASTVATTTASTIATTTAVSTTILSPTSTSTTSTPTSTSTTGTSSSTSTTGVIGTTITAVSTIATTTATTTASTSGGNGLLPCHNHCYKHKCKPGYKCVVENCEKPVCIPNRCMSCEDLGCEQQGPLLRCRMIKTANGFNSDSCNDQYEDCCEYTPTCAPY